MLYSKENFFEPGLIKEEDIILTHSKKYYKKLISQSLSLKEIRPIGFPMSELLIERERKIAQGTIECTKFSFKNGISMNIAGGTHHAFYDKAEGFCMLNDQAIAANYLLNNGLAKIGNKTIELANLPVLSKDTTNFVVPELGEHTKLITDEFFN